MKEQTQEQKDSRIRQLHAEALKIWPQVEKIIDELKLLGPHSMDHDNALLNTVDWLEQLAGRGKMGQIGVQVYSELELKVMEFMRDKRLGIGGVLTAGNSFRLNFIRSLNPMEQSILQDAVQSLHNKGLLTEELALTEVGFKAIYS